MQNRENLSLFFAYMGSIPTMEMDRVRIRPDISGLPVIKNRILQDPVFPNASGSLSEGVWRHGRMTVPVCVRIRHFSDFVLYLTYRKGGQYVQKIYP